VRCQGEERRRMGRKIFRLKGLVFAGPWFMVVRERNVLGCLEVEVGFEARFPYISNTTRASILRLGWLRKFEYSSEGPLFHFSRC